MSASWPPPLPVARDPLLRIQAFTLPTSKNKHLPSTHYQRLEFLGDRYLELVVTRILFDRFPGAREGPLTRVKETLVANKTLARYAAVYNFGTSVYKVNGTDKKQKGSIPGKVLADCFEAYIAAVALSDSARGFDTLVHWLSALFEPEIKNLARVSGLIAGSEAGKRIVPK